MNNRIRQIATDLAENITTPYANEAIETESAVETFGIMLNFAELNPILQIVAEALRKNELMVMIAQDRDLSKVTFDRLSGKVSSYEDKTIYIAGRQSEDAETSKELTRASTLYAFTQFVAQQVFKNDCKPYAAGNDVNQKRFAVICERLMLVPPLDMRLTWGVSGDKDGLEKGLLPSLVRLIWMDRSSYQLQRDFPELMEYFQYTFLPACELYLNKLNNSANAMLSSSRSSLWHRLHMVPEHKEPEKTANSSPSP